MRRFLVLAALFALALPSSGAGAIRLGLEGNKTRFHHQTGQRTQIHMRFTSWGSGGAGANWIDEELFRKNGPIPMVAFGTRNKSGGEALTPRGIARGRGDHYLFALSKAVGRWGKEAYIRPMAEMNGHWNYYCAYNANGTHRGPAHSQESFRKAFKRIYLIMHGGLHTDINTRLEELNLPHLTEPGDLPLNTLVRVVWNPQGYGSPNVRGNRANAYYPGDNYVDVVANDLYDIGYRAEWDANLALLKSHPSKPYAIGEFGLWGIDDPAFIRRMANFVSSHRRVEFITYYQSAAGSVFDLGNKPSSRRAYRRYITPLGN